MSVRFGAEELPLDDQRYENALNVGERLVQMGAPSAADVGEFRCALRVETREGFLMAMSNATFNAAKTIASRGAPWEVVLVKATGGKLHVLSYDDLCSKSTTKRFVKCAYQGSDSWSSIQLDVSTPPSFSTLQQLLAEAMGVQEARSVAVAYDVLSDDAPPITLDSDDDVLLFVDDLEAEGAVNLALFVSVSGDLPKLEERPRTPEAHANVPIGQQTRPQDRTQANTHDENQRRFVSIRCEFNPPEICVVGDLAEHSRKELEEAVLEKCVGKARLSVFRTRPCFVRSMSKAGIPYFTLTLKSLHFDEDQQTMFLLCVLDTMDALRNWRMVPCDGEVTLDESILEQANTEKAVALRAPPKPNDSSKKFTQAFELLFVERKPL